MKIKLRPTTAPFQFYLLQVRVIIDVWAKFVGGVLAISLFFGPIGPLVVAAVIFSLAMPILLLSLWGRSLDTELKWTEPRERSL